MNMRYKLTIKKRWQVLPHINKILVVAGLLLLIHCKNKPLEQDGQTITSDPHTVTLTDAQFKNAPVETSQLLEKNIATILRLNGKIDVPPQSLISVSVPLGGYLKSTRLLPGMQIHKGQIIAVMEDPQYVRLQQEYLQAKSKLEFATMDYERQRTLNESQASSNKVMQQAQAEVNNQQIVMNALAQQLRLININPGKLDENAISRSIPVYSPINGFVSKVNVNKGKYVTPADILFELIDPDDIHLNLKVYEKNVGLLSIGQKLVAFSNTGSGKKYKGQIIHINRAIGSNGASEVHCHIEQYGRSLLPGMYMNAEIEVSASQSRALPEESVLNFEGKDYVFVQTEKRTYKLTPIIIGENENGFIQVVNNTHLSGKNIVTKNAYTLLMALKNTSDE